MSQKHGRLLSKIGVWFYSNDHQKHLSKLISPNCFPSKFATWRKLNSILARHTGCTNLIHRKSSMGSVCRHCGSHCTTSLGIRRDKVSVLSTFFYSVQVYCVPTVHPSTGQGTPETKFKFFEEPH